jgi:phosphoglycolate phosphatase
MTLRSSISDRGVRAMDGGGGSQYRALVFDFDGTLADTHHAIATCLSRTFDYHGAGAPSLASVRATIGSTLPDSLVRLGAPLADVNVWVDTYRRIYAEEGTAATVLYPGACEVLGALAGDGIPVAVVSNKGGRAIHDVFARSGMSRLPVKVFAADTSHHTKPDPLLMHKEVLGAWPGVSPGDLLVVGDTRTDIVFAQRAGADICWVTYGYGNADECRRLAPTYTVDELVDLLDIVN